MTLVSANVILIVITIALAALIISMLLMLGVRTPAWCLHPLALLNCPPVALQLPVTLLLIRLILGYPAIPIASHSHRY
jgi:hypothetical protein